jgi:hypothetical protein
MQAQADSSCRSAEYVASDPLNLIDLQNSRFATSKKNVSHLDISSTALKVDCPACGDENALGDSLPR